MRKEDQIIVNYKRYRDESLKAGNKFLTAYFQAKIVERVESAPFSLHKKKDLEQHRYILYKLLEEILGFYDEKYFMAIYYEIILSDGYQCLTGNEDGCRECEIFFAGCARKEYVYGAYCLHMSYILERAKVDMEVADRYAANILKILEIRYGIKNFYYAKMKLHIIGEYYYNFKREEFLRIFMENYQYLEEILADSDSFLCEVMLMYTYCLWGNSDIEYRICLEKCEALAEYYREDMIYNYLKCKINYLKAQILRERNDYRAALELLENTMVQYPVINKDNWRGICGYVYLEMAHNYKDIENYIQMYESAKAGLEICHKLDWIDSELYYNLYDYIGIKMMQEGRLKEAKNLYSSCVKEIVKRYGKDNENYVWYMNNLGLIALKEGRDTDIYASILMDVKNIKLKKQVMEALCNELLFAWVKGDSIRKISKIYKKCVKNMQGKEFGKQKRKMDTIYLAFKITEHIYDEEALLLMKTLEDYYINNFIETFSIIYWYSVALYRWTNGKTEEAFEIYERIIEEIREEDYVQHKIIIMDYIQLLIEKGQYEKAKSLICTMLDKLYRQILDAGLVNIRNDLLYYRIIISMYLSILCDPKGGQSMGKTERKQLLEKIVCCKTIEREIKSILNQYKDMDADNNIYSYCQAYRKLAALELRMRMKGEDREYYSEKKRECVLEMEEQESILSQKIPFAELVHQFRIEDLDIPKNAICAEYFAYYKLEKNSPVIRCGENQEAYGYFAFILKGDKEEVNILDTIFIPFDEATEDGMYYLIEASEEGSESEEKEIKRITQHLYSLFGALVMNHVKEEEVVYLGLDFQLQLLPMDLVFYGWENKPINLIMVDSARYIKEDTKISIEGSDALIMGNPQYNIDEAHQQRLPEHQYSEAECKAVAEIFATKAYTGKRATQKVLLENFRKNVIHISAHGDIDISETVFTEDLLIGSYIMLAGYEDWKYKRKNKEYGNGVVTGDDFLFMDLSGTDLVVLSTCVSSLGAMKGLEAMHGMRWAIGTAGAGNSVTSLWSVSDCASAVLMILFYRNLREMPIGRSLYEAKQCLRTITIKKLRKDEKLWGIVKEAVLDIEDEDYQPFAHWRYWAAFVCYCR